MARLAATLIALAAICGQLGSAATTTTTPACSCTTKLYSGKSTITYTITGSSKCTSMSLRPTCPTTSTTSSTTRPVTTTLTTSTIRSTTSTTSSTCRPTPTKGTGKRGVAYNSTPLTNLFSLSCVKSKHSWAYNWYSAVATDNLASSYNSVLTFIPMLWSAASDLTSVWSANANKAISSGSPALLAFNEPDVCWDGTACMNISAAVSGYQTYMQPFAGKARLGAPAVTNALAPQGLAYLKDFLGNCTRCTVDFVPIHWYGDAAQTEDFKAHVQQAYSVAGNRPIWVTEFGCTSGTEAQIQTFLRSVLPWLDAQSWVEKYSYFMARPGLLVNSNGTALSAQGVIVDQL